MNTFVFFQMCLPKLTTIQPASRLLDSFAHAYAYTTISETSILTVVGIKNVSTIDYDKGGKETFEPV